MTIFEFVKSKLSPFLFLYLSIGTAILNADELEDTVARLSMVTRVVNGIAIQQELNKNALKPIDVAADMIGVKDGGSLLKFSSLSSGNTSTKLDTLFQIVATIHGNNVKGLDEGMEKLGGMKGNTDKLKLVIGIQIPSELKQLFEDAANFKLSRGTFDSEAIGLLNSALTAINETDQTPAANLSTGLKSIKKNIDEVKKTRKFLQNYEVRLKDLLLIVNKTESIKKLKVVAEVSENYSKNSELFTSLKQNAGNLKTTVREMIHATATSLEWGEIGDQLKKTHKVISDIPTSSDRKMTLGFPNNGKDVAEIGRDLKNAWIKENLAGGKDMKELDALLNPLVKWGKTFQAIYDSWGSMMSDSKSDLVDISSVIIDLAEHGKTLSADTDAAKYVETIENCVNKLGPHDENNSHFGEFQRLHDFVIASDEKVTTLKTGMEEISKLNMITNATLVDVVKNYVKKADEALPEDRKNKTEELQKLVSHIFRRNRKN